MKLDEILKTGAAPIRQRSKYDVLIYPDYFTQEVWGRPRYKVLTATRWKGIRKERINLSELDADADDWQSVSEDDFRVMEVEAMRKYGPIERIVFTLIISAIAVYALIEFIVYLVRK